MRGRRGAFIKFPARRGERDRDFLESVFQKLLLNFTWWVNRKDAQGKQSFRGRLSRPGQHRRVRPLKTVAHGRHVAAGRRHGLDGVLLRHHADHGAGTGARERIPAYEDMASKFFEHFVQIADAINTLGGTGLWDEEDGFYYDQILFDHTSVPLKTRSLVGLLPLIAVEVFQDEQVNRTAEFQQAAGVVPGIIARIWRAIIMTHYQRSNGRRLLALPSRRPA